MWLWICKSNLIIAKKWEDFSNTSILWVYGISREESQVSDIWDRRMSQLSESYIMLERKK